MRQGCPAGRHTLVKILVRHHRAALRLCFGLRICHSLHLVRSRLLDLPVIFLVPWRIFPHLLRRRCLLLWLCFDRHIACGLRLSRLELLVRRSWRGGAYIRTSQFLTVLLARWVLVHHHAVDVGS